jgi:hypothetical protein
MNCLKAPCHSHTADVPFTLSWITTPSTMEILIGRLTICRLYLGPKGFCTDTSRTDLISTLGLSTSIKSTGLQTPKIILDRCARIIRSCSTFRVTVKALTVCTSYVGAILSTTIIRTATTVAISTTTTTVIPHCGNPTVRTFAPTTMIGT